MKSLLKQACNIFTITLFLCLQVIRLKFSNVGFSFKVGSVEIFAFKLMLVHG